MTDLLIDAMGELAPAAMLTAVLMAAARFRNGWAPLLAGALFLADAVALNIGSWAPELQLPGSSWNWAGKAAGLALALGVLMLLPAPMREKVGLFHVPPRRHWGALVTIVAAVVGLALARTLAFGEHIAFDLGTIAYQATMPGLHEEMTFRGVWWVLLAAAIDRRDGEGIPWGTLAVTTLLFGSVHAIDLSVADGLRVNWLFFVATGVSGFFYGFLQGVGRAVWIPVLAHNLANVAIYLTQMLVL